MELTSRITNTINYKYSNMPIYGGGYATGFIYHPEMIDGQPLLYVRNDIGGTYRFNYKEQNWECLSYESSMIDLSATYPIAFELEKENQAALYIVCGVYPRRKEENYNTGRFLISNDFGKTYITKKMPCMVHGNLSGRGSGKRLVRVNSAENVLYYASQCDGLFITKNLGDTWENVDVCGEKLLTFVWCSEDGKTLIVGTAGTHNEKIINKSSDTNEFSNIVEKRRGTSLYISYDAGEHFEAMEMPEFPAYTYREGKYEPIIIEDMVEEGNVDTASSAKASLYPGYVAHRYDFDGKYFYCTLTCTGNRAYNIPLSYSCDSGKVIAGRVLRYEFDNMGRVNGYKDITPDKKFLLAYGFGGVCSCPKMPGLVAASTICKDDGDTIFISKDYGETWEIALHGLEIGNMHFNASYMQPKYNGGGSLIHWLSDIKINPNNPDEIWFNTGTGVYRGDKFTKDDRSFQDISYGLENTVHMNIYGPVSGPVKVIDLVGDLGGFAFTDLDKQCENTFADKDGHRFITCINADASDEKPTTLLVTGRGNWKGKTKGGIIKSEDYGLTWRRLPFTYGISDYLDERFKNIERPNVNPGWVAMSPDTNNIVFCTADRFELKMKGVVASQDGGNSFSKSRFIDISGNDITDTDLRVKVFSDRLDSQVFYAFADGMRVFLSENAGLMFHEITVAYDNATVCNELVKEGPMGIIDTGDAVDIRSEHGKSGVFYLAFGNAGLWKLMMNKGSDDVDYTKDFEYDCKMQMISCAGDIVYRVGLGLAAPDSDYISSNKALYVVGTIDGIYGFFRTKDMGTTWEKLNTDAQNFGRIQSIDGDKQVCGRFFLATGSFGSMYGTPV